MWRHRVGADHHLPVVSSDNQNSARCKRILNFFNYAVGTGQLGFIKTAEATLMSNFVNAVVIRINEFLAASQ